jgi:hypothetical protein
MSVIPESNSLEVEAQNLVRQIRALLHAIPGFGVLSSERRAELNGRNQTVSDRYLESVAVALDASLHLSDAAQATSADVRHAVRFAQAFLAVADELTLLARGLRDTVLAKRGDAVNRGLAVYAIAKTINRPGDRELLIPHVDAMKRTLGRGRPRLSTTKASAAKAAATGGAR